MSTISNVDRVILLIRQRLKEHAKAAESSGSASAAKKGLADHVRALAALDGVEPRQVKRALIEQILAEEFGAELVNDASFQQVVQRVFETLDSTEATRGLTDTVIADLRKRGAL